jgi:hypothetical protein
MGRSGGKKQVSVEHFPWRADECRRLAADAGNASDKAFWLGLVARWEALEIQKAQQPIREKSTRRRQSVHVYTKLIEASEYLPGAWRPASIFSTALRQIMVEKSP